MSFRISSLWLIALTFVSLHAQGGETIPLPEHPRPDFERVDWKNLNGEWEFRFDAKDEGLAAGWSEGGDGFDKRIVVPFPWGSKLSGVEDEADIGWYLRTIEVPGGWNGKRIFLVVGASDWVTEGWLDGKRLGRHQGGYTPFEFELTDFVAAGESHELVLRVDDTPHPFKLEGKQGYGEAKGIWQTAYLEARSDVFIRSVHFTPDVDEEQVDVRVVLSDAASVDGTLRIHFKTGNVPDFEYAFKRGEKELGFAVPMEAAQLWSLDSPFLYEVEVSAELGKSNDQVASYFGMRKISVERLPGTDIPYVALNEEPVYLQLALDQSYHPDGYYTFPSDAFMRDEILRSKRIGLNGNRIHIKVEVPRKLYWADKLGLLIMADVPNFWGEPTEEAKAESEFALRGMIERDYNHPSIFSWVTFNETWGLFSGKGEERRYLPETQRWVVEMYRLAKQLDGTRLVEDNSPCNYDHTETDLNTWHDYLPGYLWKDRLEQVVKDTYEGSKWNFIGEYRQGDQPLFNSECGNVWGYHGSTGDVDWSWDYHIMMNEFRRHPEISGWLYTEHHDVINEWNGYYRFDRSEKETGLGELVSGMSLRDLHSPVYLSTGSDLCRDVEAGEQVEIPMTLSVMTGDLGSERLRIRVKQTGWDRLGKSFEGKEQLIEVDAREWSVEALNPLVATMPKEAGLTLVSFSVETQSGQVLHRNFTSFNVEGKTGYSDSEVVSVAASEVSGAEWSQKQWEVLDGLKLNGAGSGYFEYTFELPEDLAKEEVSGARFVAEVSAKRLFAKDREGAEMGEGDYMRGAGELDSSKNPNAYPMTDTEHYPTQVFVTVNGYAAGARVLEDDPADHRGILSWRAQTRYRNVENDRWEDRRLHEAGSYGYLLSVAIPEAALQSAWENGKVTVRLAVDEGLPGGLAVYGKAFGRYPVDPSLVLERAR